jgi:hypothetical protein
MRRWSVLSAFIRLEDHVCSHGFMGMDTCIGFYREAKKNWKIRPINLVANRNQRELSNFNKKGYNENIVRLERVAR